MNRHDRGDRAQQRRRVRRRKQDVEMVLRCDGWQPDLLPPGAAGTRHDSRGKPAGIKGDGQCLGGVKHELVPASRCRRLPTRRADRSNSGQRPSAGRRVRARRSRFSWCRSGPVFNRPPVDVVHARSCFTPFELPCALNALRCTGRRERVVVEDARHGGSHAGRILGVNEHVRHRRALPAGRRGSRRRPAPPRPWPPAQGCQNPPRMMAARGDARLRTARGDSPDRHSRCDGRGPRGAGGLSAPARPETPTYLDRPARAPGCGCRRSTGAETNRSYASSSVPTFFRGSSVPRNSTYPAPGAGRHGSQSGAPGEQTVMRSAGTPSWRSTSMAVK